MLVIYHIFEWLLIMYITYVSLEIILLNDDKKVLMYMAILL